MSEQIESPLFTVNELSKYIKLKPSTIYRKKNAGELPFTKLGGKLLFPKSQIDTLIESKTKKVSIPLQTPFQNAKSRLRSLTTEITDIHEINPRRNRG